MEFHAKLFLIREKCYNVFIKFKENKGEIYVRYIVFKLITLLCLIIKDG